MLYPKRFVTKSLDGKTLYEVWMGKMSSVGHLKVFGSIVHVKSVDGNMKKLDDKGKPMIL